MGLEYDGALQKSRKVGSINLSSIFTDKVLRKLHEFLMLMEVRLKQGQIEDFILKTTPFMYELMRYYFTKELRVNWRQVEKKTSMGISLDMVAFESQYPKLYTSWKSNTNKPYRQELQLSFYNMLHMLEDQDTVDTSLLKQLKEIRRIEKKFAIKWLMRLLYLQNKIFVVLQRFNHCNLSYIRLRMSSLLLLDKKNRIN